MRELTMRAWPPLPNVIPNVPDVTSSPSINLPLLIDPDQTVGRGGGPLRCGSTKKALPRTEIIDSGAHRACFSLCSRRIWT